MAAVKGHDYAQAMLGACYYKGWGTTIDKSAAAKWTLRAANQGLCEAQYSMGEYYVLAVGVRKDKVLAYMWLNLSAASTDPNSKAFMQLAKKFREQLSQKMSPDELIIARQLSLEFKPKKETIDP